MLTLTGQKNFFGELTTGTANTAAMNLGGRLILADTRRLVNKMSGHLLETSGTASAVAERQRYQLPNNLKKLRSVTFTIGSEVRPVERSFSKEHWDSLNRTTATAYTSDYPQFWRAESREILYWPTPASGSAVITYNYDKRFTDQTIEDYTTGTINTATRGSAIVVGASTVWTSAMARRFIKISKSNTVANDGDGNFYEIASVANGTTMTLVKTYEGNTISSGAASYLIGEASPLPDGFHELPVYRSAAIYYGKNDEVRSGFFAELANDLEKDLLGFNDISDSVVVEERGGRRAVNPNDYPYNLTDA